MMQATLNKNDTTIDDSNSTNLQCLKSEPEPMAIQKTILRILGQHGIQGDDLSKEWHLRLTNYPYPDLVLEKEGYIVRIFQIDTRNKKGGKNPEISFAMEDGMNAWKPIAFTEKPVKRQGMIIDRSVQVSINAAENKWSVNSIPALKKFTHMQRKYSRKLVYECWTQPYEVTVKNKYVM